MKKTLAIFFTVFALLLLPLSAHTALAITPGENITNQDIDKLNPLKVATQNPDVANKLTTPGGVISRVLEFAFPIAGFILFIMIVWGGFEMLMGATSKKMDAGKQRVTAAIIGFLLLFISFWIIQIVDQALLGGHLSIFQTAADDPRTQVEHGSVWNPAQTGGNNNVIDRNQARDIIEGN